MSRLIIGLMSGTSLDGTDALAVRFSPEGRMTRLGRAHRPFPADLRDTLFGLATARLADEIERAGEASVGLADEYAETVLELLRTLGLSARDVTAIAVHGQTVRHRPEKGFSLQLNHPARLAERTGIDVLCDFRARDIAAGGQGAPLVPAFHRAVFAGEEDHAVLNVGGIANVTILTKEKTEGFDTGPGNMLLDAWCQREKGEAFDRDGAFARKGRLLPELLDELLSDPYFTLPPPKSTGRETFHLGWLTKRLGARRYAPEDVARTLTVLTARTATDAIRRWAPGVSTLFVCGGGALNPLLMEELRNAFDGSVHSTEALGIDPMDVECQAFAWLGHRFLERLPGNLPAVTGARGERILGALYPH